MAIVWGSWVSDRFRCGVELTESPTSVSTSTGSVSVTAKVYFQTKYNGWDSGIDWSLSGSITGSGTKSFDHGGSNEYTLMGTVTKSFSTSYTGSVTVSVTGKVSGWAAYGGTASVTASTVIDRRPYSVPAAPTSFTVSRVSDTQQNLAWARTSTTGAPVTNTDVQRWDNVSNTWTQIATLGNVASYSNTSTVANRQYRYRIKTRNSAGSSAWVYSAYIVTTPAAPGAPTAAKTTSGSITVTRPALTAIASSWEVWHAANGVWDASPLATVAATTSVYTHTAPSTTVTHTYRLRAVAASPTLYSANSANSNVVQLLSPPNAPTSLAPSGVAVDADEDLVLTWQHNPVDTTAQTSYQLQYRVNGGAWTIPAAVSTSASTATLPAGTFSNGTSVEWQVRTWGAHATASPWSASATLTASSRPTAAINVPDTTYSTSKLTVEWGFSDAEGSAQSAFIATLFRNGVEVEEIAGSGAATSATFSTRLVDGLSYSVSVSVRDGSGLWSAATVSDFTVDFSLPPAPSVDAVEWDAETGAAAITFSTAGPAEGQAEAASAQLWRTLDEPRTNVIANADLSETLSAKVVRTNLCTNPAPSTVTGWASATQVSIVPAPWDSSRTAFRALATGSGTHYVFTATGGSGVVGEVVTVSATLQVPAGVWYRANVHARTGNVYYTAGQQTLQSTGEPVRISHTATLTADAPDLDLAVLFFSTSSGGVIPAGTETLVGDVLIEKVGYVGSYFDGDTAETDGLTFAWTGTAGASSSTATGLQIGGGWFTGGTGSAVTQGPASDSGFYADVRGATYVVSPQLTGGAEGEHYSASVVVQGIPGETPAGTTVQVRIHDGAGYIADASPVTVSVPDDGSPLLVSAVSTAPAGSVSNLRLYVYPNSKPVRISEPIAERVSGPGVPVGPFVVGTVGDDSWVLVAGDLAPSSTVLDTIPPVNARVTYRVTAETVDGALADSWPTPVETPAAGIYLNGGPGFATALPLLVDPVLTDTTARDREVVYFAGRSLPLEIAGANVSRTFAVTAVLLEDGTTPSRTDVRDFVLLSGPACLRDPDGTRAFVSIGDATVSGNGSGGARGLSWSFTEIDWQEDATS